MLLGQLRTSDRKNSKLYKRQWSPMWWQAFALSPEDLPIPAEQVHFADRLVTLHYQAKDR